MSSDYLKLEVLPNAIFFERTKITAFYDTFFETVARWVPSSSELSRRALDLACRFGLGAVDPLHVAAAEKEGAELVTAEKSTKPMLQITAPNVMTIRTENGEGAS